MKWTVHRLTSSGWMRAATAHWWESKADAAKQMEELSERFPNDSFRLQDDKHETTSLGLPLNGGASE